VSIARILKILWNPGERSERKRAEGGRWGVESGREEKWVWPLSLLTALTEIDTGTDKQDSLSSRREGPAFLVFPGLEGGPMDYLDELEILAERYGLAAIYAFGSRGEEIAARVCGGRSTPGSSDGSQADLDIGVQPAPDIHLGVDEKVLLALALEELFDVARVDLVVIPEVDPFLAVDIIRGELLYCRNLDEQAEHELYVLRRAADLACYEQERRRLILSGGVL